MIRWKNLTAASLPAPNDVWRVTVQRANNAARLGVELLTLSLWDTSVESIATDWALRIHNAGLGVLRREPVTDEDAGVFVVDMQFDSSIPLVPASRIVSAWEDMISNTEVLTVERVTTAQRDGAGAVAGQQTALAQGAADAKADSIAGKVGDVLNDAKDAAGDAFKWTAGAVLLVAFVALLFYGAILRKQLDK